jgi:predicted nucleic acid-binding protein
MAAAGSYLRSLRDAHVSVISRAEVLAGTHPDGVTLVTELLDRYPTLQIDKKIADLAAELRRTHRWKLPDAFQAAVAQVHGLQLATRNTRDFPPARYPWVVEPYQTAR